MTRDLLLIAGGFLAATSGIGILLWPYITTANFQYREARRLTVEHAEALAAAEEIGVAYNALTTETTYLSQVDVNPPLRTRWSEFRARFTPEPATPDWAPGEVLDLPPSTLAPPVTVPVRTRGPLHPSRQSWPLKRRSVFPTPADVAARLRSITDPTRVFRVTRSF